MDWEFDASVFCPLFFWHLFNLVIPAAMQLYSLTEEIQILQVLS